MRISKKKIALSLMLTAGMMLSAQVSALANPTVEFDTTGMSREIFANGLSVIVEDGTVSGTTTIYLDRDGDGVADVDEAVDGLINMNSDVEWTLYGGSDYESVVNGGTAQKNMPSTDITIKGGSLLNVYGGSYVRDGVTSTLGSSSIIMSGGSVNSIYAGEYIATGATSNITTANVTITGGTGVAIIAGGNDVQGGVSGNTIETLNLTVNNEVFNDTNSDIYIARYDAITNANMNISDTTFKNLYATSDIGSVTNFNLTLGGDITIGQVYNGSAYRSGIQIDNDRLPFKIDPDLSVAASISLLTDTDLSDGTQVATDVIASDVSKIIFEKEYTTNLSGSVLSIGSRVIEPTIFRAPGNEDFLLANGLPLLIAEGDTSGTTTIYHDKNTDGQGTNDELIDARTTNADLSKWNIFGGISYEIDATIPQTNITMTGGKVKMIYGGNDNNINEVENVQITVSGGEVMENIYSGGTTAVISGSGEISTVTNATVEITGGTIRGNVYASGRLVVNGEKTEVVTSNIIITGGTVLGEIRKSTNTDTPVQDAYLTLGGDAKIGTDTTAGLHYGIFDTVSINPNLTANAELNIALSTSTANTVVLESVVPSDIDRVYLSMEGTNTNKATLNIVSGNWVIKDLPEGTVTGIVVTPTFFDWERGNSINMMAAVNGVGTVSQEVTFSAPSPLIVDNKIITVPAETPLGDYIITATSTVDSGVTGRAIMTVVPAATVTGVKITPAEITLKEGSYYQFTAEVIGDGNVSQDVNWTLSGADTSTGIATSLNQNGLLYIPVGEPSRNLTVRAVPKANTNISVEASVRVVSADATLYTLTLYDVNGSETRTSTHIKDDVITLDPGTYSGHNFEYWINEDTTPYEVVNDTSIIIPEGDANYRAIWTVDETPEPPTPEPEPTPTPSGGGGRTGVTDPPIGSTPAPTVETGTPTNLQETITDSEITIAVKKAITAAGAENVITPMITNVETLTEENIKVLAFAAAGKTGTLYADSIAENGSYMGRMYLPLGSMSGTYGTFINNHNAYEMNEEAQGVFNKFFTNTVDVATISHKGAFPMAVDMAVKFDLTGMDANNLHFYSYDMATNTYIVIDTDYYIDSNGFVHFSTTHGNTIVVSSGALTLK